MAEIVRTFRRVGRLIRRRLGTNRCVTVTRFRGQSLPTSHAAAKARRETQADPSRAAGSDRSPRSEGSHGEARRFREPKSAAIVRSTGAIRSYSRTARDVSGGAARESQ